MLDVLSGFRLALRSLTRNRRFLILAVATLALGIGITTAFFSVFDTILLRPLAYNDADRLVTVLEPGRSATSPANFVDLKAGLASVEHLTAASPWGPVMRGSGAAEQLAGLRSSSDLFELLGVAPQLGRTYRSTDATERVVVLGHDLWQRRFGGDRAVLGRSLQLDGNPYTVIGVMPAGFQFPPFWATDAEFWAPFSDPDMWSHRGASSLRVFGRLGQGEDVVSAQLEVDQLAAGLAQDYPDVNFDLSYHVEPMSEPVVEGIRPALQMMLFGVGLVLMIACANVASLWLTRTSGRGQELAVRRALGAQHLALWRQGLAESLWVVTLATGFGWLLALWGLEIIQRMAPPDVPRLSEVTLDGRVLVFAVGVGLLMCLAFSCLLPLFGSSQPGRKLTGGGSRRLGERKESRGRFVLVTAEVAMAVMLLLASGLMLRSLLNLWQTPSGLRSEGVLTAELPFGGSSVEAPEDQNAFFDRLLTRMQTLPGVDSAALINHLHLGGDIWSQYFEVEGHPVENPADGPSASFKVVSEGLFETFGIPLLEGRQFRPSDDVESRPVVIVNQRLAAAHWPGESAIGKRIRGSGDPAWLEIVGVVGNVRQWTLTSEPRPEIYYPYRQNPVDFWTQTSLVVTTSGDEAVLIPIIGRSLRSMDPELPFSHPRTLRQIYGELLWQPQFSVSLLTIFALAAVVLAAIGGLRGHVLHGGGEASRAGDPCRHGRRTSRLGASVGRARHGQHLVWSGAWTCRGLAVRTLARESALRRRSARPTDHRRRGWRDRARRSIGGLPAGAAGEPVGSHGESEARRLAK